MQRTLALIKPDAYQHEDKILWEIKQAGFTVIATRHIQLTTEQASSFYAEHAQKPFFNTLVQYITSGPIVALVLQKENAVSSWRQVLGPTDSVVAKRDHPDSLRAKFGTDKTKNACHGSDSRENAEREIRFFFPDVDTLSLPATPDFKTLLESNLYPTLTKGLTELCRVKPENPTVWLGEWLLRNNPSKPRVEEPSD